MTKQFEQYIRELAIFGSNCVENIPFQDESPGVLMRVSRKEMNIRMSEICQRYDQDYWIWTPADFDLVRRCQTHEGPAGPRRTLQGLSAP